MSNYLGQDLQKNLKKGGLQAYEGFCDYLYCYQFCHLYGN